MRASLSSSLLPFTFFLLPLLRRPCWWALRDLRTRDGGRLFFFATAETGQNVLINLYLAFALHAALCRRDVVLEYLVAALRERALHHSITLLCELCEVCFVTFGCADD